LIEGSPRPKLDTRESVLLDLQDFDGLIAESGVWSWKHDPTLKQGGGKGVDSLASLDGEVHRVQLDFKKLKAACRCGRLFMVQVFSHTLLCQLSEYSKWIYRYNWLT